MDLALVYSRMLWLVIWYASVLKYMWLWEVLLAKSTSTVTVIIARDISSLFENREVPGKGLGRAYGRAHYGWLAGWFPNVLCTMERQEETPYLWRHTFYRVDH